MKNLPPKNKHCGIPCVLRRPSLPFGYRLKLGSVQFCASSAGRHHAAFYTLLAAKVLPYSAPSAQTKVLCLRRAGLKARIVRLALTSFDLFKIPFNDGIEVVIREAGT